MLITIDGYPIDAALSEEIAAEAEVTSFPVESGADITDNVKLNPITVTITGVVSDTPIGEIEEKRAAAAAETAEKQAARAMLKSMLGAFDDMTRGLSTPPYLPSEEALSKLERIRDGRAPVTITTSLRTYDNMVMTSLSIPRSGETGRALEFTATFQQVTIVEVKRVTVTVSKPPNLGTQPGKDKDTPDYDKVAKALSTFMGPMYYDRENGQFMRPDGTSVDPNITPNYNNITSGNSPSFDRDDYTDAKEQFVRQKETQESRDKLRAFNEEFGYDLPIDF